MNIFICARAIVIPLVFFIAGHKYVVNPLLLFSTLIMPFLWLIYYSEPAMTFLSALGVLVFSFFYITLQNLKILI